MDEQFSRSVLIPAGALALALTLAACESWFGPAEGDGIRGVTPSTIEVVSSSCCGAYVRLDGGPIQRIYGRQEFTDLSAGRHTVAIQDCSGSCRGGWGGCYCNNGWSHCTINLHQGGYVSVSTKNCY